MGIAERVERLDKLNFGVGLEGYRGTSRKLNLRGLRTGHQRRA